VITYTTLDELANLAILLQKAKTVSDDAKEYRFLE